MTNSSQNRLLDLVDGALDDCGVQLRANVVIRQPPAVVNLDDLDRRCDSQWDRDE